MISSALTKEQLQHLAKVLSNTLYDPLNDFYNTAPDITEQDIVNILDVYESCVDQNMLSHVLYSNDSKEHLDTYIGHMMLHALNSIYEYNPVMIGRMEAFAYTELSPIINAGLFGMPGCKMPIH